MSHRKKKKVTGKERVSLGDLRLESKVQKRYYMKLEEFKGMSTEELKVHSEKSMSKTDRHALMEAVRLKAQSMLESSQPDPLPSVADHSQV